MQRPWIGAVYWLASHGLLSLLSAKLKMCSGATMEEIEQKLKEYKDTHNGKDFMCDVSTKTIEDICQLLQCQPEDLIEWKVDLKPELAYETRFKE